jgi:WD40 repeat protein
MSRRSNRTHFAALFLAVAGSITLTSTPSLSFASPPAAGDSVTQSAQPASGLITNLKFSPDGKHVLARDGASVFVLTREPFSASFRIDAPGAEPAWFTSDSKSIVVSTADLKIEVWNVASRSRASAYDGSSIASQCLQTQVSLDVHYVACLNKQTEIELFDLSTLSSKAKSSQLFDTLIPSDRLAVFLATTFTPPRFGLTRMAFSPDGRYFLAARSVHPIHQAQIGPGSIAPYSTPEEVVKSMGEQRVDGYALTELTVNDLEVRQTLRDMGVDRAFQKWVTNPNCCRESDTGHPHGFDNTTTVGIVAKDVPANKTVTILGDLKAFNWGAIVFVSPEKLLVQKVTDPKGSELVSFPDGKLVRKMNLAGNTLDASGDGSAAIMRPTQGPGIEIIDMKSGKSVLGSKSALAMDVYGTSFVTQSGLNEVGLYDIASLKQLAQASLSAPAAAAASADATRP